MYKAHYKKHTLEFIKSGGTSRGVLNQKDSYFIILESQELVGIGECSILPKLSPDDLPDIENTIDQLCRDVSNCQNESEIESIIEGLQNFPALRFGLEVALIDLKHGGKRELFKSTFTRGDSSIPINGLIWMGEIDEMKDQVAEKIDQNFRCIKIKIGALDFNAELELLKSIRRDHGDDITLRVDANGAFTYMNCFDKLKALAELNIHSIEQPIPAGHAEWMKDICVTTPLPIALDEELIGYQVRKPDFLRKIKPQFLVLKPSLLGGFKECEKWIKAANELHIGWWVTSALESNIGLNAIAQWTATLDAQMYQGLGTGQVFSNNIPCPLYIKEGNLHLGDADKWQLEILNL